MAEPEVTDSEIAERPTIYKIIAGKDMRDLAIACNTAMYEGWVPLGGPMHSPPGPQDFLNVSQKGALAHPYWQAFWHPTAAKHYMQSRGHNNGMVQRRDSDASEGT